MLLGRTAMQGHLIVDPDASFLTGRSIKRKFMKMIKNGE
jgi:hypothetical protein